MTERNINVYELGLTGYDEVHLLQQRLQAQRREGGGVDSLLLTEHRPVFTLGRSHPSPSFRASAEEVERAGIPVVATERGGDITYHGPGQMVAYGIIDLRAWELGVIDYVTGLEETIIRVVGDWGLDGQRVAGSRGIWIGSKKVASVGLNVRRWVTMHGVAINVEPDMAHFGLINPCGLPDAEMTSLRAETGKRVLMDHVAESLVYHFSHVFECECAMVELAATGT